LLSDKPYVPGKCTTEPYYTDHKKSCDKNKDQPGADHDALWNGKTVTNTIIKTFNGTDGMTAITEPTVTNGRLNPKGKITGYNWASVMSLIPLDLLPAGTIPDGAINISASIASVSYTAYLKDASGVQIADTVNTGTLF
jgi:hypothetical protein